MQVGDLVAYKGADKTVIGVIVGPPENHEFYLGPAVQVWWSDDESMTHEPVSMLRDAISDVTLLP